MKEIGIYVMYIYMIIIIIIIRQVPMEKEISCFAWQA